MPNPRDTDTLVPPSDDTTATALVRLLFIPVSGPRGMGEYARCMALARGAMRRWPAAEIHFALSGAAPYAADTPFPTTLLASSPTFHSREVSALIRKFRPTVAIFDNAGRTAQLRSAHDCGARVVFVSSRRRQRRKAFRWRWMGFIDEHWIAYPEFIAGALTPLERLKLKVRERPRVRFLDTLLSDPDPALAAAVMNRFDVKQWEYVLIVPGGGTPHSTAATAPAVVAAAACSIAERGYPTILVGVPLPRGQSRPSGLRLAPRMPMEELGELIRGARLVISNGGDTLLQALACRRPCIAVAIAGDQAHRIVRCVEEGLVTSTPLDASALARAAAALLDSQALDGDAPLHGAALRVRGTLREVANAMGAALDALGALALPGNP